MISTAMHESTDELTRGVIYVVSGARSYMGELMTSLRSLRRHEPDLPVTVFSSLPVPAGRSVRTEDVDPSEHPLKLKVYTLRRSPYDETIFLDTDTTIRGPLTPLFEQLRGRDFCAANSHEADYSVRPPRFIAMVRERWYNTGVLVYRKSPATMAFLHLWEEAVRTQNRADMWAGHNCDQHHFNQLVQGRARTECSLRWADLDNARWNCRGIAVHAVRAAGAWHEVRILHHRTAAMKMRKLAYSLYDFATLRIVAAKAARMFVSPFRASSRLLVGD